jgi:hypothetical protein
MSLATESEPVLSPVDRQSGAQPIPGYRLLAPLGRGGFGEVWKCEAPGGLLKAIKFVAGGSDLLTNDAPAEEELRAIQHVKAIRHPFLLSMERVEFVKGELVIVLELADHSLADVLVSEQRQGRSGISRETLLAYLREAAEALDVMHFQHRLQHLDVKPRNLFLVANHVKVGDFGLVQALSVPESRSAGLAVTALYAAPEIFRGQIGCHADQYSLAIVYQELLTGTLPFTGRNARQLLFQHAQAEPDLSPLPESDRAVVARALSKDPARRYPSCSAFIQALSIGQSELVTSSPLPPVLRLAGDPESGRETCSFRFSTHLRADVARMRLGGFERQWNSQVVATTVDGIVLRMEAPRSTWQRWTGRQPHLEVRLVVTEGSSTLSASAECERSRTLADTRLDTRRGGQGAEVRMEVRPRECTAAQSAELVGLVGSLLAESLRSHLQSSRPHRTQERLDWRYTLNAAAVLTDGTTGPTIECQGKDISLGGIGFYLPGELPSTRMILSLPQTPLTAEATVPVRVVRTQPCADGWLEVGAVLEQPNVFPEADPSPAAPSVEGKRNKEEGKKKSAAPASRFPFSVLLFACLIALGAGAAHFVPSARTQSKESTDLGPSKRSAPLLASRQDRPRQVVLSSQPGHHADLHSAIAATPDGGILLVRGRHRCKPVRVTGKSITIRGDGAGAALERIDDPSAIWEPLLGSDRPLVLASLKLSGDSNQLCPLAEVENASLTLRDCRVTMPARGPALALRRGRELCLERCRLTASGQGLTVEVGERGCRVAVTDCRLTVRDPEGALLVAWSDSLIGAPLNVDVRRSAIDAGRLLVCRGLSGLIAVRSQGNRLRLRQDRVSFAGYADPAAARRRLSWREVN